MASISYGTASSIEVTNRKYIEPETFLPAYPACIPGFYNMEVQIYRGYWMLTWFVKEFAEGEAKEAAIQKMAAEEVLNKHLMEIPPGSQGLVLQPYWGPGLSRPEAKGAIVGFSDYHTKIHIYRAIIEGIAYGLREGLEGIERRQHKKIKQIMVSGGGSRSDAICQITADIFGVPVSRVQTYETASLGTAILAFVADGQFESYEEAVEEMVHKNTTFYPNKEAHEQYDYLYNKVYEKMYPRLRGIYKSVRKFNRKFN
jgi:sugar (pentulose or hexulose) kinase